MHISRRSFVVVAASGLLAARAATAQTPARTFEESYRSITPQPTRSGDKIEVIDFFWYGCPYCYQLMPLLTAWEETKPADVVMRRVPAVLREDWLADAHLYYVLEQLGEADRLHSRVFDAMHRGDRLRSGDIEAWAKWAVANGIDRAKWEDAYHARSVRDNVLRAMEMGRDYDVRGTPALVVDGRYQTGGAQAGAVNNVVPTLEGLIKLARERRKKSSV